MGFGAPRRGAPERDFCQINEHRPSLLGHAPPEVLQVGKTFAQPDDGLLVFFGPYFRVNLQLAHFGGVEAGRELFLCQGRQRLVRSRYRGRQRG